MDEHLLAAICRLCMAEDLWAVLWDRARERGVPLRYGPILTVNKRAMLAYDILTDPAAGGGTWDLAMRLRCALEALRDAGEHRALRWFACWCAWQVLPAYEAEYPDLARPRWIVFAAQRYARGLATREEMLALRDAARADMSNDWYSIADEDADDAYDERMQPGLSAGFEDDERVDDERVDDERVDDERVDDQWDEESADTVMDIAEAVWQVASEDASHAAQIMAFGAMQYCRDHPPDGLGPGARFETRVLGILTRLCLRLHRWAACGIQPRAGADRLSGTHRTR